MLTTSISSRKHGLSLVEILVTMVVIAIIAGVAVPMLSNVFSRSQDSAARRNAQQIASAASSASAAGNTEISDAADKEEAVRMIVNGVSGEGQFANDKFSVSLTDEDRDQTLKYLAFSNGQLEFDPQNLVDPNSED